MIPAGNQSMSKAIVLFTFPVLLPIMIAACPDAGALMSDPVMSIVDAAGQLALPERPRRSIGCWRP